MYWKIIILEVVGCFTWYVYYGTNSSGRMVWILWSSLTMTYMLTDSLTHAYWETQSQT